MVNVIFPCSWINNFVGPASTLLSTRYYIVMVGFESWLYISTSCQSIVFLLILSDGVCYGYFWERVSFGFRLFARNIIWRSVKKYNQGWSQRYWVTQVWVPACGLFAIQFSSLLSNYFLSLFDCTIKLRGAEWSKHMISLHVNPRSYPSW